MHEISIWQLAFDILSLRGVENDKAISYTDASVNKKIIAAFIIVLVLLAGLVLFQNQNSQKQTITTQPTISPTIADGDDRKVVLGVFEGTIPCADCEGIKMKLTLYQDPTTLGAAGFTLDSTYIGQPNGTFNTQGQWDYLRGNSEDPNATIYGLDLDKPQLERQYFLKVGDDKVTMLDENMNPIKSNLNYTLKKVNP